MVLAWRSVYTSTFAPVNERGATNPPTFINWPSPRNIGCMSGNQDCRQVSLFIIAELTTVHKTQVYLFLSWVEGPTLLINIMMQSLKPQTDFYFFFYYSKPSYFI